MAALDDYEAAAPTWLVLCRIMDTSPAPLLVTELQRALLQRTDFRVGRSVSTLLDQLQRMDDDGIVRIEHINRGRRRLSGYVLTDEGRAFVALAIAATASALQVEFAAAPSP